MATRTQVARFRSDVGRVRAGAVADVGTLWGRVASTDALRAKAGLTETLPPLLDAWGDVASVVAADAFDAFRASSSARGRHTSRVASRVETERVLKAIEYAITPAFAAEPDLPAVGVRLTDFTDRLVAGQADATMQLNAQADRAAYAWVPSSAKPCAFCQMLASRGPVYHSDEMARHDHCSCVMVPVWGPDELPGGYDPGVYEERYRNARRDAGSGDVREILAQMRRDLGVS